MSAAGAGEKKDLFHVIHKVPAGDSPYSRAKHLQGNLGWAYMQNANYVAAEVVYRKAQEFEADANKACNLSLCLAKQHRYAEARDVLDGVLRRRLPGSDEHKTAKRAEELLQEMESLWQQLFSLPTEKDLEEEIAGHQELLINGWTPLRSKRLPIFEKIAT